MNSSVQIAIALVSAGAIFICMCAGARAGSDVTDAPSTLRLLAQFHSPTEGRYQNTSICLASNANGWRADGTEFGISQLAANPLVAGFEIPWNIASDPDFEFKFTRGAWETVEVGADGHDIANRRLTRAQIQEAIHAHNQGLPHKIDLLIEGFADERAARWPALEQRISTVTGDLRIHEFTSAIRSNSRKLRVWLPPDYESPENTERRYPVLYMNDGQNLFDAATSFSGEWGVDETATRLIKDRRIRPMIIVGIDNAGAARGDEYLPGPAGPRRPGAGGKADEYLRMISDEIMPLINREYRTKTGAEHTTFGGSSFGGVVSLHAAMTRPQLFGAILVESPSLWVEEGAFLSRVSEQTTWPGRVFLAMGDREYSDAEQNAALVTGLRRVEASMRASGLGNDRLRVVLGKGDAHNEAAWRKRLPEALEFLFEFERPDVVDP